MYAQSTTTYKKTIAIVFTCVVLWSFPDLAHGFLETSAARTIGTIIYAGVIGMTGWLLGITSYAFEFALGHFVWSFGEYYQNYFGFAIEQTWQVVRDLMNFVFIFGLIYIGFRFILNADDQTAKKSLISLILAALLVNFSLFATKAVVDISHLAAKQLQSPIQNESMEDVSYADALVNSLRVTSVLSDEVLEDEELGFMWLVGLAMLSGALILVASFTLGSLALLLVSRFVYLTFLMIFSPILFLGWVFPGMSGVSKKWSDAFLKQAFLAPALILFLSIALAMVSLISQIDGVDASGGLLAAGGSSGSAGDSTALGAAVATKIPFFIVAIGFYIGALLAARQMGTIGAGVAIKLGQNINGRARSLAQRGAGGAVFGGVGYAGRRTFGAMGDKLVRSTSGSGTVSKSLRSIGNKARTSSWDARQVGNIGKDIGIGTGKKGGYAQRQKDINKKEQQQAEMAAEGERLDIFDDAGVREQHEMHQDRIEYRNNLLKKLGSTINKEKRGELKEQIKEAEKDIQEIETGTMTKPESYAGTDQQWIEEVEKIKLYNQVRKDKKKLAQNKYAKSIADSGKNLPFGVRQAYNVSRVISRTKTENENAAASIQKDVNKGDTDKIIDALKENSNKDE